MNIIIVGCGKVGCTLVEALSIENHNIVVIDSRPEKVSALTDTVDVMGIVGNGVSHTTLKQAGIETADLLIAVTGSDEENLLCCVIAKKSGHCQTIARIRNPIYNEEKDFLQKEFGLSMIINPELTAANEISKVFQFPSAIRVDTFAKGRVELLHFKIGNNSPLCGLKLSKFHATMIFWSAQSQGTARKSSFQTVILNLRQMTSSPSLQNAGMPSTFSARSA